MDLANDRRELAELLKAHSVKRGGHYVLASGRTSDVYVDAKLTVCKARGTRLVGRVFLAKFQEMNWRPAAVGGLVIGADPIVMAIARESLESGAPIDAFLVRKEPKKHGLHRHLEGLENPAGMPVVIIEDVCTTGDSTALAIQSARSAGMHVQGAVCLVDREEGGRHRIASELGCPFASIYTLKELVEPAGQAPQSPEGGRN